MSSTARPFSEVELAGKRQKRRLLLIRLALVAVAIFYALFPVLWVFAVSINPRNSIVVDGLIPTGATFRFYEELLRPGGIYPFLSWLWNSVRMSLVTMVLSVMISTFGAYAFSRFRFTGRRLTMLSVFLIQIFPSSLLIIAIFVLIQRLGEHVPFLGLNTAGGAILVYLGGALGINTWLMKGFFDSIPRDLDEAAIMDGATRWQTFWLVIFPLVRPILAVVGILVFISTYNDYVIALTLLRQTEQQTLAVGLNLFIGQTNTDWGFFAAGAMMGAIPIVVLYLLMQDFIVGGLTSGAVKG
jgi:ABC-type maltose transport system permease subunit